ncbi:MAG TPA: 30S ribosome-binding factor RbfA [Acholeplasmataceae bacterium]|jgi:ribosome-binding factor A|nr:30S ribosome-binding factor RbfA [Acholeplasmataceae bacterium]
MAKISTERLASLIQREVAIIINNEIKDLQVGYINVTEVRVTRDHSFATVYYTILSDDEEVLDKAKKLLEKNNGLIRMKLAEKIRNTRKIPELIYKFDQALAYGNHIEKILAELKKD